MGLENEYGISSQKSTDPVTLSNRIVLAYARYVYPNKNIRWDYDLETPLHDERGFDLSRSEVHESLLTDEDQNIPNLVLPNGARFYVDHAHPEYSSPEVLSPLEIVKWDLAGEQIMKKACELDALIYPEDKIRIFKNNVDNKGASYGTHENYIAKRSTDFNKLISGLTPHFISRQIYCGAGRVGIGQNSEVSGFQISQRADYIEAQVGLETTLRRPIINTRDEPHADPKTYRRLHVINGDANMSDFATLLKVGVTSIIIKMIEEDFLNATDIQIINPVEVIKNISHDIKLEQVYETTNLRKVSAVDMQEWYLEKSIDFLEKWGSDKETDHVIELWEQTLNMLKNDRDSLKNKVDWIAKYELVNKYMDKNDLEIDDPLIKSLDFKYSEITSSDGIGQILKKNNLLSSFFSVAEVDDAVLNPPISTRAWLRGRVLSKYSESISAASWDSLIFDLDKDKPLVRISTANPLKGTKELTHDLIENSNTASELVDSIRERPETY